MGMQNNLQAMYYGPGQYITGCTNETTKWSLRKSGGDFVYTTVRYTLLQCGDVMREVFSGNHWADKKYLTPDKARRDIRTLVSKGFQRTNSIA